MRAGLSWCVSVRQRNEPVGGTSKFEDAIVELGIFGIFQQDKVGAAGPVDSPSSP